MTSSELYYQFHILLNRNAKFENARISVPNFVLLFNREKDRWLDKFLKKENVDIDIHNIQELYVHDYELALRTFSKKGNMPFYSYFLPSDYFKFSSCTSLAKKDECLSIITNYLIKPRNKDITLNDDSFKPNFEFQEGICNISDNHLLIYSYNYSINLSYLSYYKAVPKIDIEGYIDINGKPSSTINPILSDYCLEQILDMIVTEVIREWKDQVGFSLSKERENFNS